MTKHLFIIPCALILLSCSTKQKTEGSIIINLSQKRAEVPTSMYGVFFEEINHGGNGGL